MVKILKYSLFDLFRSRWTVIYFLFFHLASWVFLYFGNDLHKGIASLLNMTLILVPLVSMLFGVIHFYNSREFIELLLAQPVRRRDIFMGMYAGLAGSLSLGYVCGIGIPFIAYGLIRSAEIFNFFSLIVAGVFLTFIFTGFAYYISMLFDNRLKGFGLAMLVWLFMAFIYDGLFLVSLLVFREYPVEKLAIFLSFLNPVDLSRTLVMLKLDMSALLGYTGAVFQKFFGTNSGMIISISALVGWTVLPVLGFLRLSNKKDF
jgi:Cu-processing system permease protein